MLLTLLQFFATKFLFLALHLESGAFHRSFTPELADKLAALYSLRFPLRTFRARLTSKAISMRSISALLA